MSTQAASRTNGGPEPKSGDKPGKKKFGLVLQGAAALGAYEVGAIEYLYESGMECAIASGASSGAMNAATLAGAKGYPPQVLRELWGMLAVDPPIPFLPSVIRRSWSMFGVPHMYTPRLDYWNLPSWTYAADNGPYRKTLFLQNKLKADSDTSRSYTRFIRVLKQVDEQLPADAPVRQDKDWAEVMNYALVRQIRMIDMNKPAEESGSDWSPEAISRRISAGYDQTKAALEEAPLAA
jgi:Patatin-like phospholipase